MLEGKSIAIFRFKGAFYAMDDMCPHAVCVLTHQLFNCDTTILIIFQICLP